MSKPDIEYIDGAMLGDLDMERICDEEGYAIPCPFCGSEKITLQGEEPDLYWYECENCGIAQTVGYARKDLALTEWNRRAQI